ncbi:hypothetical protein KUD97_07625 [Desulfovibrio desulfuricans]|uniref:hypothetical protein n=1 Tax=Desulfovibrio desulfuricans TaxID=876 RepID=UPI001F4525C8|nr:hypothetical protein [Desulfovibrio desulfuricans]UIA98866.1 hypothetical protein KUD97_07625 [Desulfovibrio desulfuricans]
MRILERLRLQGRLPQRITEFSSKILERGAVEHQVQIEVTSPVRLTDNEHIESSNEKFREKDIPEPLKTTHTGGLRSEVMAQWPDRRWRKALTT